MDFDFTICLQKNGVDEEFCMGARHPKKAAVDIEAHSIVSNEIAGFILLFLAVFFILS